MSNNENKKSLEEIIELGQQTMSLLEEVPEAGKEWAVSASMTVEGIIGTIEDRKFCTQKMENSIKNINSAAQRWVYR